MADITPAELREVADDIDADWRDWNPPTVDWSDAVRKAADRIERLEAENERLHFDYNRLAERKR